ncbi:hypothetical protein NCCP133_36880 [Cytobacillus sp. NCCP-133]|nr:hypothetical protein NCCP133_36880 [Cytobacillus sp. NCCP-133]
MLTLDSYLSSKFMLSYLLKKAHAPRVYLDMLFAFKVQKPNCRLKFLFLSNRLASSPNYHNLTKKNNDPTRTL